MDFSKIINELNNASLFELYRLNSAIWDQLEDQKRLRLIKDCLKIGQTISYFDASENRLIEAEITELKRTKALVKNKHDHKLWNIAYYLINMDNVDISINTASKKINKSNLKIGDKVCFKDKKGNELFGDVIKLNQKTAGIIVGQVKWRVAYGLLTPVIDGEIGADNNLIDGEVIKSEE